MQWSRCSRHPSIVAHWGCADCGNKMCSTCVKTIKKESRDFYICPNCSGRCEDLRPSTQDDQSWLELLGTSFSYPVKNGGWLLLLLSVVFFYVMDILVSFMFVVGIIFAIVLSGYMSMYLFDVARESSQGEDDLPSWPQLDFGEAGYTYLVVLLAVFFSFLPIFILLPGDLVAFLVPNQSANNTALLIFLLFAGVFYLPMALLVAAIFRNPLAPNPLIVVPAIYRVIGPYTAVFALWSVAMGLYILSVSLAPQLPLVGVLFIRFTWFYFLVVGMRALGLLFRQYKSEFSWLD